ncbi:MAG: outer membrane beta-barrel protein [Bacteroidales bacterium]|jgi:hypothetical protein|nr:outer membrane beta-barrel protein [Bacteroidales bacterium]
MKQTAITLVALLIFTFIQISTSLCQKNYLPGQVVTNEGDTISGYIDYQHWSRSPASIKFSKEIAGTPEKYGPLDIQSFQVANDIFESRSITVSESPRTTSQLSYDTKYPSKSVTAFLLVLVSGKVSLYQYIDEMGTDYYYVESATYPLMELTYFKYYVEDQGKRGIAENTKFRGQLIAVMSDDPELHKQITKANYNPEELSEIIAAYNNQSINNNMYVHNIDKAHYRFGVFVGAVLTRLDCGDKVFSSGREFSVYPVVGVSMLFEPNRGRGKWTIYTDLNYTGFDYKYERTLYANENWKDYLEAWYNTTYLKLAIMGRFNFIGHKVVPYIAGGGFFATRIVNNSYRNEEKFRYGNTTYYSTPLDARQFDYGFSLGLGARFKKFSLDTRYEWGGISPYSQSSHVDALYIIFGYTFN